MRVIHNINDFPKLNYTVVTSGTFDGVHLGHQKILKRLTELAKANEGQSVVVTYWPHPRTIVSEDSQDLKLLTTIDEKIELLEANGVDYLLVVPFTREFSELSSQEFIQKILVNALNTKKLVIGYDHRFGRNREGGFDHLTANIDQYPFEIEEISKLEIDALKISSTHIRTALLQGNATLPAQLLGRYYSLSGFVVKGRQLGRQLGFPTANIQIAEIYKLLPEDGVYAVFAIVRDQTYKAVMNIGMRPTVEGLHRTVEVHIFDFDEDIYGETLKVLVVNHIRKEQKFAGLEELKAQILADCGVAKTML